MANPVTVVDAHAEDIVRLVQRGVDRSDAILERTMSDVSRLRASMRALSPLATLERGYAIVHTEDGGVVSDPESVSAGQSIDIRVRGGHIPATVRKEGS